MRHVLTACLLIATLLLTPWTALRAADVAPIFTLDSNDPVLTLPTSRGGPNPTSPFIPAAVAPWAMIVVEDTPDYFYATKVQGIAIVNFTGDWEWSFDGVGWNTIASASEAVPLGLSTVGSANLMIRFAPSAPGSGTLTFRAWDDADGSDLAQTPPATSAGALSSPNGGAGTFFSAETRTLQATVVLTANALPTLTGASPQTFSANRYGSTWDLSLLTAQFSDADSDPIGIAITGLDPAFGTWSYNLGSSSTTVSLNSGEALLLPPYATLSCSPYMPLSMGLYPGAITCQAWDQTFGVPGVAGGIIPLLGGSLTVDVDVDSGNNSPYWQYNVNNLDPVLANETDPPWQRLNDLIRPDGSAFYDDDGDLEGIAIIANSGSGWEWAIDSDFDGSPDSVPTSIPDIASAPAALLLSADYADNIIIRYLPSLSDGGTYSLTIRAWDQTDSAPLSPPDSSPSPGSAFSVGNTSSGITTIDVDVTAVNSPPGLTQPVDILAVAGQPWQILVTVSDADNEPDLTLEFDSAAPGVNIGTGRPLRYDGESTYYRTFPVSGTAAAAGTVTFTLRANDGTITSNPSSLITVTVVAAADTVLTTPVTITTSTAANPLYGAIAPGSTGNYQALNSAFGDLFPDRARGVWWNGGYRDLPTLPGDPLRQGVLLATTIDRPFSLTSIPRQAAPFAITLPANSWSLVGVPPLVVDAVPTVEQTHSWDLFRLEDLDGVPQDAASVSNVMEVSYQGVPSTRPFLLSGSSYVRNATLDSGTAYWIPNFSSTTYRLVRTLPSDPDRFGAILAIAVRARSVARASVDDVVAARSGPPAPPAGTAPPAADDGGGSCGAGGLAGLLLAGLALLGLRPRRRS